MSAVLGDDEIYIASGTDLEGVYVATLTIGDKTYFPQKIIGAGTYGTVLKYVNESHHTDYMIVKVDEGQEAAGEIISDDLTAHQLLTENKVQCDFITSEPLCVSTVEPYQVYIKLESMDGNLYDLMDDSRVDKNKVELVMSILPQIRAILQCLLDSGIVYYDVKPANVLYTIREEQVHIKLGDIGSMTRLTEDVYDKVSTYCFNVIDCRHGPVKTVSSNLSFVLGCTIADLLDIDVSSLRTIEIEENTDLQRSYTNNLIAVSRKLHTRIMSYNKTLAIECMAMFFGRGIHMPFSNEVQPA